MAIIRLFSRVSCKMHKLNLLWAAHNETILQRRRKRFRSRQELESIEDIPETLFIERFRLNKEVFKNLCRELRTVAKLKGSLEIPLETKVLCTLSFLATGCYQKDVGVGQQLTQRTTSRCIQQVVDALTHDRIVKKYLVFPQTQQERSRIEQEFQSRFNLPGVIGAIDCTHVSIVKPAENEHLYFNREGYHSLNVQMVCNNNLEITYVNAKFGGARLHDSDIWSASGVEPYLRELHQTGEYVWLLGDCAYPQRPWLMTPVLNADPGSREGTYASRHKQARNCIKCCFDLLKARWRCLQKGKCLHYHPRVATRMTLACCVLHNIALKAGLPTPTDMPVSVNNEGDDDNGDDDDDLPLSNSNLDTQSELIQGRAMLDVLVSSL